MEELLKRIDALHLSEEEQVHWEYVIAKLLDKHMPANTMSKEDLRFLKEHGWYALFYRTYSKDSKGKKSE